MLLFNLKTAVESPKSAQTLGTAREIKKSLITNKVTTRFLISLWALSALSLPSQAYQVTMNVNVAVSQLDPAVAQAQVICQLIHPNATDVGTGQALVLNGAYQGPVAVVVEASEPLLEYEQATCELKLCRQSGQCATPLEANQISGLNNQYLAFDRNQPHRLDYTQPLAESLIMVTPPPFYQMAGASESDKQESASQSAKSRQQKAGGKGLDQGISEAAGAANTNSGYAEAAINLGLALVQRNAASITAAGLSLVGVQTNWVFSHVDGETDAKLIMGAVGDAAGLAIAALGTAAEVSAAAAGTAAATGAAATGAAATAAAGVAAAAGVVGVGTGSYQLTRKLDKLAGEPFLVAAEYWFRDDEDESDDFKEAAKAAEARRAATASAVAGVAAAAVNTVVTSSSGKSKTGGKGKTSSTTGSSSNSGSTGTTQAAGDARQNTQSSNTSVQTGTGGDGDNSAGAAAGAAQGGQSAGSGGNNRSNGVVSVVERQDENGKTTITWSLSGHQAADGSSQDGIYHTEYSSDGSYVVYDMWGNKVADGTGAPDDNVQPGQSSSERSSDGSTATGFGGDDSGSSDSASSDSDASSDDETSESSSDCAAGDANCTAEEEESPAEEEPAETPGTETAGDSTPDPRDRDSMSEGIAWAMRNPDNPFAQQILATAAQSILDLSDTCKAGCPGATGEGGLIWAMLNPDNPLAQSILADAAEAIENNAGSGQTGGPDDNPANEPIGGQASDEDLRRIELIIAGGGVVDPPEGGSTGGSPPPDNPVTGDPQPIPGSTNLGEGLEIRGGVLGEGLDGSQDSGEINIDKGGLGSGGLQQ